jgi:hypothetical protein
MDFAHRDQKELTMKRFVCLAVAFVVLGLLGAKNLITQDEALVSAGLTMLKFESVPGKPGLVGAPPKFKVTKQTIEFLEKLAKEGKIIEVQGNGSVKIIVVAK